MRPLTLIVALAVAATASMSHAATKSFTFSGPGVSGAIKLTYGPETDDCLPEPRCYPDAFKVTGISGTITDSTIGLFDVAIAGLHPIDPAEPEEENLLAPASFSKFAVAGSEHGSLSYDNLFWPGGSPQTASDYPPHGGFLDIYGLMFDIGEDRVVNFWSNGFQGGPTPNYGMAVATADGILDYVDGFERVVTVSDVPLPASLPFLAGAVALLALRRRRAA